MITCDLCGEAKDCLQKEIDGKEYDICSECWNPLAKKLRGKGRAKTRETVFLPPPRVLQEGEEEEPKPLPGEPPIIRGALHGPRCPPPATALAQFASHIVLRDRTERSGFFCIPPAR